MRGNLGQVITFLNRLKNARISYSLDHNRDEAIMVLIAVPGQRWEVEFLDDGSIEIEVFKGDGEIYDEKKLDELFDKFSD